MARHVPRAILFCRHCRATVLTAETSVCVIVVKWTTKTVRFPTAKESWKACVFVGNLNIWAHAKSHRFWDFPHNFLRPQKCCAGPHSCHFAVAFRWCSLYPTLPPLTSGCVFIDILSYWFFLLAMWLLQLRLLFFFS